MKNITTDMMFPGGSAGTAWRGGQRLLKAQVFALPVMAQGCGVLCIRGMLWITREGDMDDHILCETSSWVPDGPGKVVIEAVEDSMFCILQPGNASLKRESGKELL